MHTSCLKPHHLNSTYARSGRHCGHVRLAYNKVHQAVERHIIAAATSPTEAAIASDHAHQAKQASVQWLQRSQLLVGEEGLQALRQCSVLMVGVGGVGSFAAECLCRAGVGHMTIVDGDVVDVTNKNRQLVALDSTVDHPKAQVMAARLRDINPDLDLVVMQEFLDPERAMDIASLRHYDYVIDCIDSVAPKQCLIAAAQRSGIKVISSMGAGGRLDPSRVRIADLYDTYNDPFAALLRRRLRKMGILDGVTVVFSDELPKRASLATSQQQFKRSYYGTCSYMPALFGLNIAAAMIRDVVDNSYSLTLKSSAGKNPRTATKQASNGRKPDLKRSNKSSAGGSSTAGKRQPPAQLPLEGSAQQHHDTPIQDLAAEKIRAVDTANSISQPSLQHEVTRDMQLPSLQATRDVHGTAQHFEAERSASDEASSNGASTAVLHDVPTTSGSQQPLPSASVDTDAPSTPMAVATATTAASQQAPPYAIDNQQLGHVTANISLEQAVQQGYGFEGLGI